MADVESIVTRLDSTEKIIQIVSESIPHLSILVDPSSSSSSSGGSSTNSRRLLSTSNTSASSSPQSPHIATTLIQSMSNGTNLNQLASDSTSNTAFDLSNHNDDYIKKLFAKQLLTLKECNKQTHPEIFKRYPNIKLWLKLHNISKSSIDAILLSSLNFHDLYEMQSETELNSLFQANGVVGVLNENELKTLFNAFQNLKHCYTNVEQQKQQQQQQNQQQQVPQQQQEVIVKIQPSSSSSTSTIATSSSSASSSPSNPSSSSSSSSMLASSCNESSMNSRPPAATTKTSTTTAATNPTINTTNNSLSSSSRCKQQRKSESDVQIDSVQVNRPGGGVNQLLTAANANQSKSNTAGVLLSTNDVGRNYYLTSSSSAATVAAANSQLLQQPVQKNVAFSPIVKNNKKTSGPKVTTPPPSRKLSTGNTGNLIQLNNPVHLSKALAVSSAASKAASKQQQQQQQQQQMQQQHIEYDEDSSTLVETSSSMATSPPMTSNMQRSSSHESHLRSKVGGGEQVVPPGTDYNNSSSKQSLSMFDDNGPASRRLSEASEMSSKCASSGQASPNLQSPSHYKVNGIFTNGDDYKNNPKSPNQSREHRWSTTYKPANCDICKKRMFFGIKCKNCKFRCHKDCEKKTPQQCSASNLMGMISANGSLFPVATTSSPNQQQHQYGESPGSNASSTMPSPALSGSGSSYSHHHLQTTSMPAFMSQTSHTTTNNNNNASSSNLSMQSNDSSSTAASGSGGWTSGVVRVANRIVSSFNSGGASAAATGVSSTPRQLHKFQQHAPAGLNLDASQQHTNHLESRSSSSCNSSEPNSPNYFKSQPFHPYHHQQQQQQQQQQYHLLNQPGIAGGAGMGQSDSSSIIMNKKSSSSSISSASIGYYQQPSNASNSSSLSQQQQAQPSPSVASSHHPYSYIFGSSFGAANSSSFANTLTPVHSIDTTTGSVDTTITMMPGSRAPNSSDDYRNEHMEDHDITMTSLAVAGSQTQNGDDRNISSSAIPTTKIDSASSTTAAGVDSTGSTNDGSGAGSMGGGNGSSGGGGGHHNDTDSDFATAQAVSMNSSHAAQDFQQFSITYEEITGKEEIGRGRFGVVYKAYWHGDVAVKEIETNVSEDSAEMKSFKEEVFNLRKTRHNNLILFIGACLKPPKCAIVMSLCRHGLSLYSYLRSDVHAKPASNIDWLIDLATQIAQGMGYLHNKQLIHKDLRSKNVFIDGCKAIITDFGLYSFTKLCNKQRRDDLLPITKECLYYMAPELVRVIGTSQIEVAFSPASDVFSFGTLWYELFSCDYPFSLYSTDTVVYLMGNGLKNLSPNIQIPKEFKVILMKCWSKEPSTRPDFSRLLETFRAIPKKSKLFRSPSHPVHIGRSLEALNAYNQMGNNANG